ncbi:MAG: hypothetical protein K2W92_02790 [Alphaproteobacteria bacterium]|nr:hypothetical protein [Alphaproteobacteria bacterium]
MEKKINSAVKGLGNASAIGMVALAGMKKEKRVAVVKFICYLFIGFLCLISTMVAFGILSELNKVSDNEKNMAVGSVFLFALPQFLYTIYTIKWLIKKFFFSKK